MFILECGQREEMLPTVISRCTELPLGDTLSSRSKKEDEKATQTACALIDALLNGTEFDVILASSAMHKNRALMKKTAEKLITVVRDAMAQNSSAPFLSGCERQALALSMDYSQERLLKIKDAMDEIIRFAEANANENLLLSRFTSSLIQI